MNDAILTLIKGFLTVLLLPFVVATGMIFYQHVSAFSGGGGEFFFWGMTFFLLVFLFFFQFWGVYEFGQKIVAGLFQFAFPLNRYIARVVPFYLVTVMLLFYITTNFIKTDNYNHYYMILAGFVLTMHFALTAQDLQQQEKMLIKPHYLFVMVTGFILTIFITVLLFDLVFRKFTFPEFFQAVVSKAWGIYARVGDKMLLK